MHEPVGIGTQTGLFSANFLAHGRRMRGRIQVKARFIVKPHFNQTQSDENRIGVGQTAENAGDFRFDLGMFIKRLKVDP